MNNKKVVTVITGVGTLTTSFASNILLGGVAGAATSPTCDATASSSQVSAKVASANAGLSAAFLTSAGKTLHANTVKKESAYKKAKGSAKAAALKAWNTAKATEAAALASFKKLNAYSIFTSAATLGTAIPETSGGTPAHEGLWQWGLYKTQIVVKGGKLVDACTSIDESHAGNGVVLATDSDRNQSVTFQGISQTWDTPYPGNLPVLWHAAMYTPASTASRISSNVQTCITQDWNTVVAPCIKGGIKNPISGTTGATYTVETFKLSLADALTKATTAKALTN